jgi:hypothetical protein
MRRLSTQVVEINKLTPKPNRPLTNKSGVTPIDQTAAWIETIHVPRTISTRLNLKATENTDATTQKNQGRQCRHNPSSNDGIEAEAKHWTIIQLIIGPQ